MAHRDDFWKLEHLSDAQLLESLSSVLGTQHRTLAALVAHLAAVEERRLHLEAAYSSMFAYCVRRLGMSEDEACRRIDLARLARAFPALFAELESGQITLSVALLLKPVLTPDNHREWLCASRGKSSQQTRELLAARFPKDDVPSRIRKLPERPPAMASEPERSSRPGPAPSSAPEPSSVPEPSSAPELPTALPRWATAAALSPQVPAPVPTPSCMLSEPSSPSPALAGLRLLPAPPAPPPASRGSIEPLSAQRYRIQFTADADLKRKLELARDLLRHAHPSGDFAAILTRALDLLLDDVQRRRFGVGARSKNAVPTAKAEGAPLPTATAESARHAAASDPSAPPERFPSPKASWPSAASDGSAHSTTSVSPKAATKPGRAPIPRAARRAVLARDGLGCSWVDADGVRCGSRAWLELDHRRPAGKGGGAEPDNVRLLCRAHNQLAAEHAYGRAHIERACRLRQRAAPPARERNSANHSDHGQSQRRGGRQPWRSDPA